MLRQHVCVIVWADAWGPADDDPDEARLGDGKGPAAGDGPVWQRDVQPPLHEGKLRHLPLYLGKPLQESQVSQTFINNK